MRVRDDVINFNGRYPFIEGADGIRLRGVKLWHGNEVDITISKESKVSVMVSISSDEEGEERGVCLNKVLLEQGVEAIAQDFGEDFLLSPCKQ